MKIHLIIFVALVGTANAFAQSNSDQADELNCIKSSIGENLFDYNTREPEGNEWQPISLACGAGKTTSYSATYTCSGSSGQSSAVLGPVNCGSMTNQQMMDACMINAGSGTYPNTTEGGCAANATATTLAALPCALPECPRCSSNIYKKCNPSANKNSSYTIAIPGSTGRLPYRPVQRLIAGEPGLCNIDCAPSAAFTYVLNVTAICNAFCDSRNCGSHTMDPQ